MDIGTAHLGEYCLKSKSPNVGVHQGIAADGTYFYLLDFDTIIKMDLNWNIVATNSNAGTECGLNHIGDGCVSNGLLYVVAEDFYGCDETPAVEHQSIAIWNTSDLSYVGKHDISAQGHECSSVYVDVSGNALWVVSWCDGTKIWIYDLTTFAFKFPIVLSETIPWIQGITANHEYIYLSANFQKIYKVALNGTVVGVIYTIPGGLYGMPGEGIDFTQDLMYVLHDEAVGTGDSKFVYAVEHRLEPGFTIRLRINPFDLNLSGKSGARWVRTSDDIISLYWSSIVSKIQMKIHSYNRPEILKALVSDARIHDIAAVYEGTYARIFLDGVVIDSKATDADAYMATNWIWQVGGSGNAAYNAHGNVYDVQVIDRALSDAEVAENRPADFYRREGSLRLWWDMKPVAGVIPDRSGFDNHGTISGPYNYREESVSRTNR
jgi:hypothetical protein